MSLRLTIRSPQGGSFVITLDEPEVRVGRASTCAVRLPYPVVSSHHLTIRGHDGDWRLSDVGSTNGTTVDGRALGAGEEVIVSDGMTATIVDVEIEFDIVRDYVEGFTLAESGTLLRKMVSEATDTGDDDLAFFEVLEGVGLGTRHPIPDDADRFPVGSEGLGAKIDGLPPHAFDVSRDGDGFVLTAAPGVPVEVDAAPIDADAPLRSSMQVGVGDCLLAFVDPLEAYLTDLDSVASASPATDESAESNSPDGSVGASVLENGAVETETPQAQVGLTAFESALLLVGLVTIIAAVAALLVIFGVL